MYSLKRKDPNTCVLVLCPFRSVNALERIVYFRPQTSGITDIDAFASFGIDNEWSIQKFIDSLEIEIQEIDVENDSMVFDMIGVDTSIANAFRRILLAEVPVMAIEDCCVLQNNSILQDEVLCHRLGLLPIACDPRLFEWIDESKSRYHRGQDPSNTLIFKLHVECTENPKYDPNAPSSALPQSKYINSIGMLSVSGSEFHRKSLH